MARRRNGDARRIENRLDPAETAEFFNQLGSEAASERGWHALAAPESDEADRWSEVEEHLLKAGQDHDHSLRRWKYFSK